MLVFGVVAFVKEAITDSSADSMIERRRSHLAVQIEKIECKEADPNLYIFHFDILPLPFAEFLEGHELFSITVNGNCFSIEYE